MEGVKQILGEKIVNILHEHASEGHIRAQKMKDIAQMLGPKVQGRHLHKIDHGGWEDFGDEIKAILCFWWDEELYSFDSRNEAISKLLGILKHAFVNLKPLAKKLRKLRQKKTKPRDYALLKIRHQEEGMLLGPVQLKGTKNSGRSDGYAGRS